MNDLTKRTIEIHHRQEQLNFRIIAVGIPHSKEFINHLRTVMNHQDETEEQKQSLIEFSKED